MQFTISKAALQKELGLIQGTVERKNTIPVLSNLLIEAISEDKLSITGTDLDLTLRCEVEAEEIMEQGSICVPARKLFEIVRLAPEALIMVKKEANDWVSIKCDKARYKLPGVQRDAFPEIATVKGAGVQIPTALLRTFIQRTIFAITNEESRYTLSGAKFIVKDGGLIMVTTDGHRLAFCEKKGAVDAAATADSMIPRKSLAELGKLLAEGAADSQVLFALDQNHMAFELGPRKMISRLLFGQFPNYDMVIPKGNDKTIIVDSRALNIAIRRTSLMADERSHALRVNVTANQIALQGQNADDGEASETVPAEYSGADVEIGFNGDYLRDFLDVVSEGNVSFEMKDGASQAMLRPTEAGEFDYKYIVMPLRI